MHNQLSEQKIAFPPKGSPGFDAKTYPGLQKYAGQAVDNGPKAKAYADEYIKVHLKEVADGKTYSEVSTLSRANPNDEKLAGQVQTLFRGETLRGLLLNVWGWSATRRDRLLGRASPRCLGALLVLGALVIGFVRARTQPQEDGRNSDHPRRRSVTRDGVTRLDVRIVSRRRPSADINEMFAEGLCRSYASLFARRSDHTSTARAATTQLLPRRARSVEHRRVRQDVVAAQAG